MKESDSYSESHPPRSDEQSTVAHSSAIDANTDQIATSTQSFKRTRTHAALNRLESLLITFSPAERLLLYVLTIALGLSTIVIVATLNVSISETIPTRGGSLVEGETGPARFINPVLALSQGDQDISALVYSGLMRATPEGTFIPDIAERYDISADGTSYAFTLRRDAQFHDGAPLTSDDVAYTVHLAQNPDIKSPHRADWEGVQVSTPDAHTIVFTLPHAYAPFMENTTFGILPKHLWSTVSADDFSFNPLNTHPIGSGPYKLSHVATDATGAATRYDLVPFEKFTLGAPHIERISFVLFPDDTSLIAAYNAHSISAYAGPSAEETTTLDTQKKAIVRAPLPRVFGVFFNQSKNPILADTAVRAALDISVDRDSLVRSVLNGFGVALTGPIPPGILGHPSPIMPITFLHNARSASSTPDVTRVAQARALLTKGGWAWDEAAGAWTKKKDVLKFVLATADTPELTATATAIANTWRAVGAQVSIQIYPLSEFNNTILRPRNYDSVLFGEVIGRDADLFAFWHSKERTDPGLNLALYANAKADSLLSNARAAVNKEARDALYEQFQELIAKDQPAVFLYAPEFLYVLPSSVQGIQIGALTTPAERFLNAYEWYIDTEHVWSFFSHSINN